MKWFDIYLKGMDALSRTKGDTKDVLIYYKGNKYSTVRINFNTDEVYIDSKLFLDFKSTFTNLDLPDFSKYLIRWLNNQFAIHLTEKSVYYSVFMVPKNG